jgi:hypothetical protein
MLKQLYYSTALALLPSAEAVLKRVERAAHKLDTITVYLEAHLEEKAVALAVNAHNHRTARERVHAFFSRIETAFARYLDTIETAFARRERAILNDIGSLRTKLDKASEARDAVAKLIGQ